MGHTFLDVHKMERRWELQSVEAEVNEKYARKKRIERNSPTVSTAAIISLLLMPPIRQLPDVRLL